MALKNFSPLLQSMATLPGVGEKIYAKLKSLVGSRLIDLLCHLPYRLEYWQTLTSLKGAPLNQKISIVLTVLEHIPPTHRRSFHKVVCTDENVLVNLIFFKAYPDTIYKQLPPGERRLICGVLERTEFGHQIVHPVHIGSPQERSQWSGPLPVYALTAGLSAKFFHKMMQRALGQVENVEEWIPTVIKQQHHWPSFKEALWQVHHPQGEEELLLYSKARERLSFDELLAHQLSLALIQGRHKKNPAPVLGPIPRLEEPLLRQLPFQLTSNQQVVLQEIYQDLESGHQMQRLLQGDVGSGKTIVALMALLRAVGHGYQGALLVPTEILATQHFETFQAFLKDLPITVGIFTSEALGKNKKEKMNQLAMGHIHIAIGTHALLEEGVEFKNLGMVVIDEQHRFGVEQRLKLTQKGTYPHVLIMTATPIPRSLAWTQYGDLSLSLLREKPAHRKPIRTSIMPLSKIKEVYEGLRRVVAGGDKVFWVCPLIEESEVLDLGAAQNRYEDLQAHFPHKVGFIHGKQDGKERDAILTQFKEGVLQILVATTVIEVGLHVGDATVMVIENAERFGLSQLHQLRGRVGRGDKSSACLLLYGFALGETGQRRLSIMRTTEDGFRLAEEDLRLRGSGDLLGTKQSGLPSFKIANIVEQPSLVELAHQVAKNIISQDPELKSAPGKALRFLLLLFKKGVGGLKERP